MMKDLTREHPDKILWRFLLPMLVSVMFQQIYNIADSCIAGRFAGEDALAAVGDVLSHYSYIYGVCRRDQPGSLCCGFQAFWR